MTLEQLDLLLMDPEEVEKQEIWEQMTEADRETARKLPYWKGF